MNTDTRQQIETALRAFSGSDIRTAAIGLLNNLGYESEKTLKLDNTPNAFLAEFDNRDRPFRKDKALFERWKSVEFLFQITDDEVRNAGAQGALGFQSGFDARNYQSYLFFALDLQENHYTRTQLADITREINLLFDMPAMLLIRHNGALTFSIIDRRLHKKDQSRDVLEKVKLIKDIRYQDPHRAHIEILYDLALPTLMAKHESRNFKQLHEAWRTTLDTNKLNKKFYRELANWYFWALDHVEFPADVEKDTATRNATNVIRLLTRLIFCWFLKEKGLIPADLFSERKLATVLKSLKDNDSTFYQAILQNLFFGTLNQRMNVAQASSLNRKFTNDGSFHERKDEYGVKNLYRYQKLFAIAEEEAIKLFSDIPFLNGGLFDCLDKEDDLGKVIYVDGFTRNARKQPKVPNFLFFSDYRTLDLSKATGDKRRKKEKVRGLIRLLDSYKFTVTENTPIEEEIALDPELLGKVFENLLASYNPETETTARKQTGSFYTPREIVNYMVDESLIAYLKGKLESSSSSQLENSRSSSSFQLDNLKQDACATIFFDPNQEVKISNRNLPHWSQQGVMYFVTFRLADSLPNNKLDQLKQERETWRKQHSEPYNDAENAEFHRLFSKRVEQWLDVGSGSCCLAKPKAAEIIAIALKYFDGERYILDEWVVMPNHVHVLVTPIGSHNLGDILHSWKSFTATKINKLYEQPGQQLWQHESYDHIVRSEKQLAHFRRYIWENPKKANIKVAQASSLNNVDRASSLNGKPASKDACATIETRLRQLFGYTEEPHQFSENEVDILIDAIDTSKILDPACGSGAFPMGILHKLVFILGKIDPHNERWKQKQIAKAEQIPDVSAREVAVGAIEKDFETNDLDYGRKLYLIENCIYGVDIQPIAIQISKLRFFISLICNQRTNKNKAQNCGVRPLPNLETKFVAANTLISLDRGEGLLVDPRLPKLEKELASVRHKHFAAQRRRNKLALQKRDAALREEIAAVLAGGNISGEVSHQLAAWNPYDQNASAPFFDPEWMFGVRGGFSVTIGNPPYVRADDQSEWNKCQRKAILASKQYETLWEKWDLYVPFIERSYKLLKPNGVTSLIVSDAYCHSKYAQKSQKWFLQNSRVLRLDFFGKIKIFDAGVHNMTYFFQRADDTLNKPERRVHAQEFGQIKTLGTDEQKSLTYRAFFPEASAKDDFSVNTILLQEICYVTKGMVVHADERVAQGAFRMKDVVSETRDRLHPKPFVEGKHLDVWVPATHKWLEWGTDRAPVLFSRKTFSDLYEVPEKILVQRSPGPDPKCCYDDSQLHFTESSVGFVLWGHLHGVRNRSLKKFARYNGERPPRPDLPKREDLERTSKCFAVKFLVAVMNSTVACDFLRANRRSNIHLYPDDWKKLPIPDVSKEKQEPIVALVDQILDLKKDPSADVSELEQKVDAMVAKLYGVASANPAAAKEPKS